MNTGRYSGNPARQTKTYDSLRAEREGIHPRRFVYVTPESISKAIRRALILGLLSGIILWTVIIAAYSLSFEPGAYYVGF